MSGLRVGRRTVLLPIAVGSQHARSQLPKHTTGEYAQCKYSTLEFLNSLDECLNCAVHRSFLNEAVRMKCRVRSDVLRDLLRWTELPLVLGWPKVLRASYLALDPS